MNISYFAHPLALALFSVPIVLIVAWTISSRMRWRALDGWGAFPALFRRPQLRMFSKLLVLLGVALLVAGIAGPQWGRGEAPEIASGRDIVCVLDLSRSMLAEDVLPNRLERAKAVLEALSWSIQERGGHRLALVGFASRSVNLCPLTRDYDHFRTALRQLDATDLPIELRSSGAASPSGTRIGAGLSAAVAAQDEQNRGSRDILLLSDGDDPARDSEWRTGVQAARTAGIPVHIIGVGDSLQGHPIPDSNGVPLRYNRHIILTRLEDQPLRDIADQTGGIYAPLPARHVDFAGWFEKQLASSRDNSTTDNLFTVKQQRYAWALGFALLFLGVEMFGGYLLSRRT
jgi:Ca-activated chloride channel family protein